jgi:hypothetical protein
VFDEFIAKGKEIVHKVIWTLANQVVERRNIMYSWWVLNHPISNTHEASCFSVSFWAFLNSSLPFCLICHFLCHLLALQFYLLLDDLLKFFFYFWSSSCASCVLDSNFKFCAFYCQCTHQWGYWETKCPVPWFNMWWVIDLPWFEFEFRKFSWFLPSYLVWRIMFSYLMVCMWQVRHGEQQRGLW